LAARGLKVLVNRELQHHASTVGAERSTRHLEFDLPEGVTYRTGDHLGVIPRNGDAIVERAQRRFGLPDGAVVRLHKTAARKTPLPTNQPISAQALLRDYVELQTPATRGQIETLARHTECPPEKARLLALAGEDAAASGRYREEVLTPRRSLLDLLEECPACSVPFGAFLEMLQPLAPRYYSISSSALAEPRRCSITVAVVEEAARSGHGLYRGVCSNYLREQAAEATVAAMVRDNHSRFRLPDDPAAQIIMIGPGTGIAPFRGFIQERAALQAQGRRLGPALIFFGCRHPEQDFIYAEELKGWAAQGAVEVQVAFSRLDPTQKIYVQHRIRESRERVWAMLEQGAVVYVCGDASRMAPDVRHTFAEICAEKQEVSLKAAETWVDELAAAGRYLVDVWSAG
jgi:cytochrome P450/NADPH-cytochrome P450 reductase